MAKVIIEIKNTVSGIKGRNLRTSIAVDGSAELDGDEGDTCWHGGVTGA